MFFPQLIAGPIIRFHQIAPQIQMRSSGWKSLGRGAVRFCFGLAKKTLVAESDRMKSPTAVFAAPAAQLDAPTAWLGALAYTFQLYFDFSGYSDMAIGLGRCSDSTFPENFLLPVLGASITDFWRRWHVTLSAWFRDYLYIPLGGWHRGLSGPTRNLVLVFLATGLWHGASWTFVVWGAYHGALLIAERLTGLRTTTEAGSYAPLRRAVTFTLVVLGWVLFRANDLGHATVFYQAMFSFHSGTVSDAVQAAFTYRNAITMAAAATVVFFPRDFFSGTWLVEGDGLYGRGRTDGAAGRGVSAFTRGRGGQRLSSVPLLPVLRDDATGRPRLCLSIPVVVFLPGVLGVLGVEGRAIENRRLTEFPAIGPSSVVDQDFYGAMSGFLTDHLPLRDLLVRANSLIALHVWKDSPNPDVHVGREDWLFTTAFRSNCPDGMPLDVVPQLAELGRALDASGRDMRLVMPPNKATLYPEFLGALPTFVVRVRIRAAGRHTAPTVSGSRDRLHRHVELAWPPQEEPR